jgi:predicted nucleotidyltransferase
VVLCRKLRVSLLKTFPSAAVGELCDTDSRIDLLVGFEPQEDAGSADCYSGLLEALFGL